MNFKMFISYAGKDYKKIKPFVDGLNVIAGLEYYLFDITKTPAEHTKEDILKHIGVSDAFLLFHSANSKKANYVQHEIGAAIAQNKPIIIAKLGRSKLDGMLNDINYFDFSKKNKIFEEVNRLSIFVHRKIAEKQKASKATAITSNNIDWLTLLLVIGLLLGLVILVWKTSKK